MTSPLVSCIMPTYNRREFIPRALHYFLRQDYAPKELIIVDDGTDPIGDLLPPDDRLRYLRLPEKISIGAKRNRACEAARGDIILHWDDDDWHAPRRIAYQVEALQGNHADVCGLNQLLFFDAAHDLAWRYRYPAGQRAWLSGSSLAYTKTFWAAHRFAAVDVGEDTRFVWSDARAKLIALPDPTIHVGLIHAHNVSPKRTRGSYWQAIEVREIERVLGEDLAHYRSAPAATPAPPPVSTAPLRNVFACLVHEQPECVHDLVRNLHTLDPTSTIVLYNGGHDGDLLKSPFPYEHYHATCVPQPRPLRWGYLHDFALACMRLAAQQGDFDTLTIVDSDQLLTRPGYSAYLAPALAQRPDIGLLGNSPQVQPRTTRIGPAQAAWKEVELWRPFLKRFPNGEQKFVHWSFWPSTVFTAAAARELVKLFDTDTQLQDLLTRSHIWATEEVILPTLVALLGFTVARNPCSDELVKYRQTYSRPQLDRAWQRPEVFWIHPVPRQFDHPLRRQVRERFTPAPTPAHTGVPMTVSAPNGTSRFVLTLPILQRMKQIEGWLEEDEADVLLAAATRAVSDLPTPHTLVEVGSYCGRSTVVLGSVARALDPAARLHAIDPHDGRVGAADRSVVVTAPSLDKFKRNIAAANLESTVEVVQQLSYEVDWHAPISLLFIDGLHDYANVARDFQHFAAHVVAGGYVAFHDYADYYPGVKALVNEVLAAGEYDLIGGARTLIVLQKRASSAAQS